jgi:CBS domain-containing protein
MDGSLRKTMDAEIEQSDISGLRLIRENFQNDYQRHLLNTLHPDVWVQEVNQCYDQLIKRTIQLAEQELSSQGMGPPPVSYVFILFGSGGRQEQTLWSDQDNGLIFEDPADDMDAEAYDRIQSYFNQLAKTAESLLIELGFPPCDGDVIASNPLWCKSLTKWKTSIEQWFEAADWAHVRYLLIAEDARALFGNSSLLEDWKLYVRQCVKKQPDMIEHMLRNTLKHKVVVGIFGHFIKEQYGENAGGIDVKYGAYIPFVNSIRLLAVLYEMESETSTLNRIENLEYAGCFDESQARQIHQAFSNVLQFRAMSPYHLEEGCYVSNGIVKASQFNDKQLQALKKALKMGRWLQKQVRQKVSEFMKLRGDKNG